MDSYRIVLDRFPTANAAVRLGVQKSIKALAFAIQEQAIFNVQEVGAIDTGALRASIYVQAGDDSGRSAALAAAVAAGGDIGAHSGRPHVVNEATEATHIEGEYEAKVGVCVEYGIYVEMGVNASAYGDIPARPYLLPAAMTVKDKAEQIAAQYVMDEVNKIA